MSKTLVAYFSASGVTKKSAEKIAQAANADIFEIEPSVLYTDADLDWRNKNSRSSVEMSDLSSRPAILKKVENMSQYDTVIIGFPIWWYTAPTIINTFIESYDLSGKKIALFATSGRTGIEKSVSDLKAGYPELNIVGGKRFTFSSDSDIKIWL